MNAFDALNRLAKWKTIFAGWQLGTRAVGDPESDAVRDHREATLLLRADVNALLALLTEKGVFTVREWEAAIAKEADQLSADLSERFPGITAADHGLDIDITKANQWMQGWRL